MLKARLYRPDRTPTQSAPEGEARPWALEFEPQAARFLDPLTGWTGSRDARSQVVLRFETREQALDFARRRGLDVHQQAEAPAKTRRAAKTYADNFSYDRPDPWTH